MKELENFAKFMTEQLTPSQQAFKAKAHLLDWYSFKQDLCDPIFRQTGRTQVIAVCTVLSAALQPGKAIEIHDHAGSWNGGCHRADQALFRRIQGLLEKADAAGVAWSGMFVLTQTTLTYVQHDEPAPAPYEETRIFFLA